MVDLAEFRKQTSSVERSLSDLMGMITELAKPTSPSIRVTVGQSVQKVVDTVSPGASIAVEPGTYEEVLRLWKPVTIFADTTLPPGRASVESAPVTFRSSATQVIHLVGSDMHVSGIRATSPNIDSMLWNITGERYWLDKCVALGDPTRGQWRGFVANGRVGMISQCFADECWYPKRDAQGFLAYDGTKHLTVIDSYFGGGAESAMIGGGDPVAYDRVPEDLEFINCHFGKNPKWYELGAQVKNAFEVKNVRGLRLRNCIGEYAGISQGQSGCPLVLTVRNQYGSAPYSTIEDVLIEECLFRFGGAGINVLGSDNNHLSNVMCNVTLRNVMFQGLNPQALTKGSGRCVQIERAPESFTLDGVTFQGSNLTHGLYVIGSGKTPPKKLVIKNVWFPPVTYPVFVDADGTGWPALQKYAPDAVLQPDGVGAQGYPTL